MPKVKFQVLIEGVLVKEFRGLNSLKIFLKNNSDELDLKDYDFSKTKTYKEIHSGIEMTLVVL